MFQVQLIVGVLFVAGFCQPGFGFREDAETIDIDTLRTSESSSSSCNLIIKDEFGKFYPMLFDSKGELLPSNKLEDLDVIPSWEVNLENNPEIVVSCAPNYLKNQVNKKSVPVKCENGELKSGFGKFSWKESRCELRPIEEVIVEVKGCKTGNIGVEYGFTNPVTKKSIILGEACYSEDLGRTNFVHSKLKPTEMKLENSALKVEGENYFRKQHPMGRYKIDLMKAWGDHIKNYDSNSINLSTKKFTLEENIHFLTLKRLPWNYALVQNEFSVWEDLQEEIREMVDNGDKVLEFWSGTKDVLKTKSTDGSSIDFYLKQNRFPVPKYNWIVIKYGGKTNAFIVSNKANMDAKETEALNGICSSKCNQIVWLSASFKNKYENKFICCDMSELSSSFLSIPGI